MPSRPSPARVTLDDDAPNRGPSPAVWHLHWFRWAGADPFSGSSLYACRCGEVRPSI